MLTLIKKKNTPEFYTDERCHIVELINDKANAQLSVARCRVERGVVTQLHSLTGTRETYLIESGDGEMDDGGGNGFRVSVGDSIMIEPNHPQRIRNIGETDLVFLVICQPRFEPACYKNLEEDNGN